ncbi:YceI family protein [Arachidicoccus sp.]|uniref:YceI family protein n=1 Tax=Arachidicoccus sp. TaxID=1872624 RepID=UPI003D1B2634
MKKWILCLFVIAISHSLSAQKYFTKNGEISFTSKTPIETIHAENKQVLAVIDEATKQIALNLLIKGFLFDKQLMQDHFNEEVIESDKYPKANFIGKITDNIDLSKPGKYHVRISGQLSMNGITKPLYTEADIEISAGKLKAACNFKIPFEDYNIKIPSVLRNNISKTISVLVNIDCNPMNK